MSKQEAVKPKPNPLEYTDINSGERNSVLTPGGMGQVVGHRLKFDPTDANQGVCSSPRAAARKWTWWAATSPAR